MKNEDLLKATNFVVPGNINQEVKKGFEAVDGAISKIDGVIKVIEQNVENNTKEITDIKNSLMADKVFFVSNITDVLHQNIVVTAQNGGVKVKMPDTTKVQHIVHRIQNQDDQILKLIPLNADEHFVIEGKDVSEYNLEQGSGISFVCNAKKWYISVF